MSKRKLRGTTLSDSAVGVILILPALAIFVSIILFPFVNSLFMSFTNKTLMNPEYELVGFRNYQKVFSDPTFLRTLKNTGVFVFFATLLPFVFGMIWAVILNNKFRGAGFLRAVTLVDWIIPGASISFLWAFIFDANHGVVNELLKSMGILSTNINFLGQSGTAMMVVVIARTWQMLPWYMAFLTGGLQGIEFDQIEAARIDGASGPQVFRYIVLPGMKSVIIIVLVLGIIGNLQHFDIPKVLTAGGPAGATTIFSISVYRQAFESYKIGLAATIGTIWAALLAAFSFLYTRKAA
ncbi:MAG TPA: sugar ABC transporter permease [Ruminococcaceae bacterium]|jgi:multiple sugar transport system permease protein|nr:sugar ABC transporter permease [Oscillospiraceae bacterium]